MDSAATHLECPECGKIFDFHRLQTVCEEDDSPLLARYDLDVAGRTLNPASARARAQGIWRWAELLPVLSDMNRVSLGEGDTPLLPIRRLGQASSLRELTLKDESGNPTGSFKARGLAVAVSKAMELGIDELVIPTAGNAGGALAAYTARTGIKAHVYMPRDAPLANRLEVEAFGAHLVLVDGLISDAGRLAAEEAKVHGWLDVSTFKEPYRVEGKKTLGFELAEQFEWDLPDVIVYPTGGGTGLVGMWKAFAEMESLGWIGAKRPRMVSVQAAGCAPIVLAFEEGSARAVPWRNAMTAAAGLRVPAPFADRLILRVIRESQGTAIAVSDAEIEASGQELARTEGVLAAPEGAATWAALKRLGAQGWLGTNERVVIFNTGSGLKYL
jgi:threonine synthase